MRNPLLAAVLLTATACAGADMVALRDTPEGQRLGAAVADCLAVNGDMAACADERRQERAYYLAAGIPPDRVARAFAAADGALARIAPAPAKAWTGPADVYDGDTFTLRGRSLRPAGFDAPELTQTCTLAGQSWRAGCAARDAVRGLLAGRTVSCIDTGARSHTRPVVDCYLDGAPLGDIIVRMGWAMDDPRYSGGRFKAAEAAARAARRGIWQGVCTAPWAWRRQQPKGWYRHNRCPGD